jgi:hypothetical protein
LSGSLSYAETKYSPLVPEALPADTPENAAYLIENNWIQLENGLAESQAAPDSASKIKVALFETITYSDLNYDQDEDAVIILTYQGGGSGTFYYLAAAFHKDGKYHGTNGIWLGDRISQPSIKIQNGLITIEYLDRGINEPMTTAASVLHSRYFMLKDLRLNEIKPAENERIYQGLLTIGHEVRSFLPCGEKDVLWLVGKSPAIDIIITAYEKTMAGFPPYTPVFVILSGSKTVPPAEGFGADYREALSASQLARIWLEGNCRSDFILLDSPLPGANISAPLAIKGRARGIWFFEGDFPVILLDAQGNKIAESYSTAKGDWMTKNFVGFEGTIDFKGSFSGQRGTLILKKDNPTGLAQFDDALEIPIHFE